MDSMLQITKRHGASAVCRVRLGGGADPRQSHDGVGCDVGEAEGAVWIAWYGPGVASNGWEPFDQPSRAAYMPFPYSSFDRLSLSDGSVFLVQRSPSRRGPSVLEIDHQRSVDLSQQMQRVGEAVLAALLESGLPSIDIGRCGESLARRLAPSWKTTAA